MLIGRSCPLCGVRCADAPCPQCRARLRPQVIEVRLAGAASCQAAFAYEAAARELLLSLKYRNRRDALRFLADAVAALHADVDVVTWAPTSAARRRVRGFDQAALLARAVGQRRGLPVRRLLRRAAGGVQTGASSQLRRHGPTFEARSNARGASVLLIDDVGTTGATLRAATAALNAQGAARVDVRCAAWTPRRRV